MTVQELDEITLTLVHAGRGLAMDASNTTCDQRLASWVIPQTTEARHSNSELITTMLCLGERISSLILYDETICEQKSDGTTLAVRRTVNGHQLQLGAQVRNTDD